MSVVVAVKKKSEIAIACDSVYSMGSLKVSSKYKVNHHKLYQCDKSWIGLVGWGALDDVFEHVLESEKEHLDFGNRSGIFTTLLSLQKVFKEKYFVETNEDDEQPVESNQMDGLVINKNGIFAFSSYRNVNEYDRFWAIGAGREYALGAMFACYDRNMSANKIAEQGVLAGCEFDDSCGKPVQCKTLKC